MVGLHAHGRIAAGLRSTFDQFIICSDAGSSSARHCMLVFYNIVVQVDRACLPPSKMADVAVGLSLQPFCFVLLQAEAATLPEASSFCPLPFNLPAALAAIDG